MRHYTATADECGFSLHWRADSAEGGDGTCRHAGCARHGIADSSRRHLDVPHSVQAHYTKCHIALIATIQQISRHAFALIAHSKAACRSGSRFVVRNATNRSHLGVSRRSRCCAQHEPTIHINELQLGHRRTCRRAHAREGGAAAIHSSSGAVRGEGCITHFCTSM